MQEKIKWIIVISMLVIGIVGFFWELRNPSKDELVYRKCISGQEYAMNNRGYKRALVDENNNPLRCK